MKLFTKEIDKKLFAQYDLGANLETQKVIAKIFNPYGRGTWYILNSDPEDPDYLWAIVDLFEVETGSVSRSELESIKVPPFGLHLERDSGFTPINAAELYKGLLAGKHYDKGGETEQSENKEMVLSQAEELEHHVKEFEEAAEKSTHVPAWIVAKAERAATDMSDAAHYLDAQNELKREEKEGEEEYALGGEVKWQEADFGDSALVVSENKMGIIIKPYGRKFHLKFVDGSEKTYDANDLKFFKDIDEFDLGGEIPVEERKNKTYYHVIWDDGNKINDTYFTDNKEASEKYYKLIKSGEAKVAHLDKDSFNQFGFIKSHQTISVYPKSSFAEGGGILNRELNIKVRELAEKKGLVPKKLGRDYETIMAQAAVSAFRDANFHSEAKKLVSALEKESWNDELYQSTYYNPEDEVDEFGKEVASLSKWNGTDIANAFIYILRINGEHRLAAMINKSMEDDNKMAHGGGTSSSNTQFMKWFDSWSNSVNKYVHVSISIPNEFTSPIKDDNGKIVMLDLIEKKGDSDAKKYMNEIFKKADEFGVSIYLQPIPRTNNLKSEEHKNKITKDYLIKYYQKFGFENTDGGFMVRAPKMAEGGWIKSDKQEDFYYYSTPDKKIKTPFWYSVHEVKDIGSKETLHWTVERGGTNDMGYLRNYARKNFESKDEALKYAKSWEKEIANKYKLSGSKMAEGGKVKFKDKVASIKASLLKRKKVPKVVQKDYGKTFSPAEAEESAKRIVGAQTARERLMMRIKSKKKK